MLWEVMTFKARISQDLHVSYQLPPRPSAFSVCLSECDVAVCQFLMSDGLHVSELAKTERVCGVSGCRSSAMYPWRWGGLWGMFGVSSW